MALREKQLGQSRPANTTAVSIYSPDDTVRAVVKTITVCNTTAGALTFRIFLDDDGTTYDETTALFFDEAIAANVTRIINLFAPMNNPAGNLAVRTSTGSGITFSAFGVEILS